MLTYDMNAGIPQTRVNNGEGTQNEVTEQTEPKVKCD